MHPLQKTIKAVAKSLSSKPHGLYVRYGRLESNLYSCASMLQPYNPEDRSPRVFAIMAVSYWRRRHVEHERDWEVKAEPVMQAAVERIFEKGMECPVPIRYYYFECYEDKGAY